MIHSLLDFLRTLTTPDRLIALLSTVLSGWYGYAMLFALIFSETGLLIGIIVPGDSLLFTVGVVAGAGHLDIVVVIAVLSLAALAGDSTAYWLGRSTGPRIFSRPDSRLFKQQYVTRTRAFYDRYGGKTIIFARFVPIVRTFGALLAGVTEMPYLRFLPFSICGSIGAISLLTLLGYRLGRYQWVQQYFDKVILGIIFLSLLPTFIEVWKARRESARATYEASGK